MNLLQRIVLYATLLSSCGFAKKRVGFWGNFLEHHSPPSYRGCSSNVFHDNTILFNPNYPQTYAGGSRCAYQIYRKSHHVCQMRIDFLVFSLSQPTGDGYCTTDYFTVENAASSVPRICGENTGSHIYIDVTGHFPVTIIVATTATKTFNRRWQLSVTQIKCLSHHRAPPNCLQYYTEPSGFIRSFNYDRTESGNFNSIGVTGSREIANLDCNICIKRQLGMCSITYSRPPSDPYAFTLTNDVKSVDLAALGSTDLQSQACATDYIVIPSPVQVINGIRTALASDRFCGLGIGEISSTAQPFNVRVVTDSNETPDIANHGFYLNYRQGACI